MKFWRANFESSHFTFDAYGETEEEALSALRAGLKKHSDQYKLVDEWVYQDDIWTVEVTTGEAYRDYSPMEVKSER